MAMPSQLVQEIQVLTAAECERVRESVHALNFLWDDELYRLGAGISYCKPSAFYYAVSKRTNPILQQHFGWMYEKLLEALKSAYGCAVHFREDLAVPGFNIYCGPTDFSTIRYNIHVDLQFTELNWEPEGSANFNSTMSFTLPIATPSRGSGLNIWNLTQNDIDEAELDDSEKLAPDQAIHQAYQLGIATIHDGKHYHQMAVASPWNSADERITLQGHGLMQNGALVIYG